MVLIEASVFPPFSSPLPFSNAQAPLPPAGLEELFPEIHRQVLVNDLDKNEQDEPIVSEVELFGLSDGALGGQDFLDLEAPLESFAKEHELGQIRSSPLPQVQPVIQLSSRDTLGLSSQTLSISPKTVTFNPLSESPKTVASKTLSPVESPTTTPTQQVQFLQYDPARPTKRTPKAARPHNGRPPTTERKPRSVTKRKNVLLENEVRPNLLK